MSIWPVGCFRSLHEIIHRNQTKVCQNLKEKVASINNLFGINRKMQFLEITQKPYFFNKLVAKLNLEDV